MATEDEVRDEAKIILGFDKKYKDISCGTGQITTFNQLGFKGVVDKPDGWYLPEKKSEVAIILEAKSSDKTVSDVKWIDELKKNIAITKAKYSRVIGIVYNGSETYILKDDKRVLGAKTLQHKDYYIDLYDSVPLDKQKIYATTKTINDILHFKFGIQNLKHRMVFTSCALVAKNLGALLTSGMAFSVLHTSILNQINKAYSEAVNKNSKLDKLAAHFAGIKCNFNASQDDLDSFVSSVATISDDLNSARWQGEDVMGIFFNEFTRYAGKSEQGQVLTPDHITSLMYRITGTSSIDHVLDGCCGTGAFLVKSMCNMIEEVGGKKTIEAEAIKTTRLFGIEKDAELHAVTCANMLIHGDGKTNIENLDALTEKAGQWIKGKNITKVLMNPPFERKYKCLGIVENVLNNVSAGAVCAFVLPDRKLETARRTVQKWLKTHSLLKIVKLPADIFDEGVTASIFVFQARSAQNGKDIFCCNIESDGLVRVKNKGRHDLNDDWAGFLENDWVKIIQNQSGHASVQFINSETDELCYPSGKAAFEDYEDSNFNKTMLDYIIFENKIERQALIDAVVNQALYNPSAEKLDIKKHLLESKK